MKKICIFLVLVANIVISGCISLPVLPLNIKKGDAEVCSAVYSNDGKFLLIGDSYAKAVAKYDANSGKLVKKFEKAEGVDTPMLILSEDGSNLLVYNEDNLVSYIYDVESGKILHTIKKAGRYFTSLDGFKTMNAKFQQNGDLTISITDTITYALIREITVPDFSIDRNLIVRWSKHYISKDGRFYDNIGYADKSEETHWVVHHVDLEQPEEIYYIPSNLNYLETIKEIVYSPDRKYMAVRFLQSIFPREEYAGRLAQANAAIKKLHPPSFYDSALNYESALNNAISPYGFFVNNDGKYQWKAKEGVRVYNLATKELAGDVLVSRIDPLAFSNDSKLLFAGSHKGTLDSNGKWKFDNWPDVSQRWIERFRCFTPDGKQLVVSHIGGIDFIDLK